MKAIFLPILEANMTHGVLRAWHKNEGERVEAGEALFEVETDKVNAEVEAETSGVVRQIVAAVGARLPVLSLIAFVGEADEALPARDTWDQLAPEAPPDLLPTLETAAAPARPAAAATPLTTPERIVASPAARRLAREHGIALEGIAGTGARAEITRADVERAVAAAAATPVVTTVAGDGHLEPTFLELLRRDTAAFRDLSSEMKVRLYREHGADIGEHVKLEAGAIVLAPEIHIGTAASIGADSTIECDLFRIGRLSALGRRTRVRCRSVEIGDALWSKDDVMIGGGGSEEPGARLRAGDACFFGEGAYLNTCHPLTLGDEVCIGSRAMLFTHSHWQSELRGYRSLFGPIEIGNHVFIGNQAFVFPGVSIGAGATVIVNSFVGINVPPATLVGGVPAQVIRHVSAPTRDEQIAIVRDRLLPELATALAERGRKVTSADGGGLVVDGGKAIDLLPSWPASGAAGRAGRRIVLTFLDNAAEPGSGVTLFDLNGSRVLGVQDDLSDDVREFCRRHGIRFRPLAWRHRVGHFEGDRFIRRATAV